ncbi:MAG: amidase, partial [Ferruginibacter sp.]
NTSLTGLAITAAGMSSFTSKQNLPNAISGNDEFVLDEITIDELQFKMAHGTLTSEGITKMYLKRIAEIDKAGPKLNAVIELNPDAMMIAASLDKERMQAKIRGPLHGIPVLIKDNINTADKMMTTAGSLALKGNIASGDAFIVRMLRNAGAVILGKTNLSEWANFRSSRSTSGWSSRGRQTKCPYILDRNPSGSSAGSGAATSANLCVLAIGTETDGSIISPSSVNGIVGIKPTVGLWSRSGIIPISITQDTAGPMARTVRDAAILLGELFVEDNTDAASVAANRDDRNKMNYTKYLDKAALQGKRIGIEKTHLKGNNENVVALFLDAIALMKQHGAEIIELDILKPVNEMGNAETLVLQYEFKDGLNKYLAGSNSKMRTLQDIIAFNKENESAAMPYFKQETLIASQERSDLNSKEYTDALVRSTASRKIIDDLLKNNRLDALSGISNGPAACIDLVNGNYGTGFSMSRPAATAGFPHITVPMGAVLGLPVGISFFGSAYSEPQLLSIAYAYEQASQKRIIPAFKENILST